MSAFASAPHAGDDDSQVFAKLSPMPPSRIDLGDGRLLSVHSWSPHGRSQQLSVHQCEVTLKGVVTLSPGSPREKLPESPEDPKEAMAPFLAAPELLNIRREASGVVTLRLMGDEKSPPGEVIVALSEDAAAELGRLLTRLGKG